MERLDCLVVGAGVVGLAIARALARSGRDVVIAEQHDLIGSEISSRNSEVIHAGLYYPQDWLKTRLCIAGRRRLYDYCASHGVPHAKLGKLVVAAQEAQVESLETLLAQARRNGVEDLVMVGPDRIAELEPELKGVAAIHSPQSGIVDSHSLMLAFLGDAEAAGAMLALGAPVEAGRVTPDGIAVEVGGAAPMSLLCGTVVNTAGFGAHAVAQTIDSIPPETVPPLHYAKGNYFRLVGKNPFARLIYPMPEPGGLGVHLTLDLGGQAKFGPDVEWVDEADYDVDPARAERFYGAIRTWWPDLPDGALEPDYAGIRPKLGGRDDPRLDFRIDGPEVHGVPGLVNLFGIESPGLTASLAIADHVLERLAIREGRAAA